MAQDEEEAVAAAICGLFVAVVLAGLVAAELVYGLGFVWPLG